MRSSEPMGGPPTRSSRSQVSFPPPPPLVAAFNSRRRGQNIHSNWWGRRWSGVRGQDLLPIATRSAVEGTPLARSPPVPVAVDTLGKGIVLLSFYSVFWSTGHPCCGHKLFDAITHPPRLHPPPTGVERAKRASCRVGCGRPAQIGYAHRRSPKGQCDGRRWAVQGRLVSN
jgi:hypothetical protein